MGQRDRHQHAGRDQLQHASSDGNPWENENWNQPLSGSCHADFPIGTAVT